MKSLLVTTALVLTAGIASADNYGPTCEDSGYFSDVEQLPDGYFRVGDAYVCHTPEGMLEQFYADQAAALEAFNNMEANDAAELEAMIQNAVNADAGKGPNIQEDLTPADEPEVDESDNSVKDTSDPVEIDDGDFGGDTPPSGIYDNIRDWVAYEKPRNTQLGQELRDGLVTLHRTGEYDWIITGTDWTGVWQFGLGFTQN